jgi:integrase
MQREMKRSVDTAAFRLFKAPKEFRWRGKRAGGLPILCERNGSVCEPLMQYFGWSHWHKRAELSSLLQEAYVLREWWAYLDSVGCPWDKATDRTLSDWRELMSDSVGNGGKQVSDQRKHDKCQIVFTFYEKIAQVLRMNWGFVSPEGPFTVSDVPDLSMSDSFRYKGSNKKWALNEPSDRNTVRRGTPDERLTLSVLTYLRNSAKADTRFPCRAEELNDRNWLLGRVMAEAGLRREEVANLTVEMIENGLRKAGLRIEPDSSPNAISVPNLTGLDAITDLQSREAILNGLEKLEHQRYFANIWITVRGKRRVIREAPFPIDFVRDLLIFGIWGVRRSQISRWSEAGTLFQPPPQIFLSEKTGKSLTGRAVGNLMKRAFAACGSNLSGHRLRAFFATKLAAKLWHEAFAENGFRWDQVIENLVLDQVARALGHKQVTTTIRHYLALAQMEYFGVPTKSKLKELRHAAMGLRTLSKAELDLAMRVAGRLAQQGVETDFSKALNALLDHPDLQPPSPAQTTEQGSSAPPVGPERVFGRSEPILRVVPKR